MRNFGNFTGPRADPVIKYTLFDAEIRFAGLQFAGSDFVRHEIVISVQNAIIMRIPASSKRITSNI